MDFAAQSQRRPSSQIPLPLMRHHSQSILHLSDTVHKQRTALTPFSGKATLSCNHLSARDTIVIPVSDSSLISRKSFIPLFLCLLSKTIRGTPASKPVVRHIPILFVRIFPEVTGVSLPPIVKQPSVVMSATTCPLKNISVLWLQHQVQYLLLPKDTIMQTLCASLRQSERRHNRFIVHKVASVPTWRKRPSGLTYGNFRLYKDVGTQFQVPASLIHRKSFWNLADRKLDEP